MNRERLINMYNATSTDDGNGEIETYEAWLERQLISRIKKLNVTEDDIKKTLYGCAKVSADESGVHMERLFEAEAKAILRLFDIIPK